MQILDNVNAKPFTWFAVLCAFWMSVLELYAQTEEIKVDYLSISDGAASTEVRDVIQDRYGLLWIATMNGLQSYDGYRFTTFKHDPTDSSSLGDNITWGLLEDSSGNLWISTETGISRMNRDSGTFKNYDLTSQGSGYNLDDGIVFNLWEDSQGGLWAATFSNALLMFDPQNDIWKPAHVEYDAERIPGKGYVLAFTEDGQGRLYTGYSGFGLLVSTDGGRTFERVFFDDGFKEEFFTGLNTITCLYADSLDILWISTRTGIYKYDPATSSVRTIVTYDYGNLQVTNNWNAIQRAPEGNVWIANNYRGILRFDGITDNYEEIILEGSTKSATLGWNITLTDFTIDKSGIFWFGSTGYGLVKYDPSTTPFNLYTHTPGFDNSLSSNATFGICESTAKPGKIYVGTKAGVDVFDQKTRTFKRITYRATEDMYGGSVRSIAEEADGILWLGTWGDGLIKMDDRYREIKRYVHDPESIHSLPDNHVRVLKIDDDGDLWVGGNNGLARFDPHTETFYRIESLMSRSYPRSLIDVVNELKTSNNKIASIDTVGNDADLRHPFQLENTTKLLVVSSGEGTGGAMLDFGWIETDDGDTLWTSLDIQSSFHAGGGMKNRIVIDTVTLSAGTYALRYKSDDSHSYKDWNTEAPAYEDLWGITVMELTSGVNVSSLFSELDIQNTSTEQLIVGSSIRDIEIGRDYIWVGTDGAGLNRIDRQSGLVKVYSNDPVNGNTLIGNSINDLHIDDSGFLWIATTEGLNKFDPSSGAFESFTTVDGLPTNEIIAVVPGDRDKMWIATPSGLSQMVTNQSINKATFINYNAEDGLGGESFVQLVALRALDGKLYFGGEHGLNEFSRMEANLTPPDLILTDIRISNKSILNLEESRNDTNLLYDWDKITLDHDQNDLSFEFAALHYANPKKNQYAHKLEGFEEEWVYDNRNYASYTNLEPGTYNFRFRGSNADGIWNEEGRSIQIIISKPWWKTWWAYGLYALLFAGLIVAIDRTQRNRVVRRERERAREKELLQAREIEKAYRELKAAQSQLIQSEKMASLGELTAGIAHEIQNPLNFVNNFSEVNTELVDELEEEIERGNLEEVKAIAKDIRQNAEKINYHGKRADGIVKGMLQHSRGSSGQKAPTDINALADEYLRLSYHGLRAKDKSFNADFKTDLDESLAKIQVVPQDIGRVLLNLINNAFYAVDSKARQSPNGYKPLVQVTTRQENGHVKIRVRDNGSGIPKEIQNKIFQPFFTTKPTGHGTGLGLSMAYDIITKGHGGTLKVKTEEGEGTEFVVQLPTKS